MNFLEQLVAEWYAYKGFFVRTNINFGKRPKGGYEGEIDVAAFNPRAKRLIHIETSSDADSWKERKSRFVRKFTDAERHYREIFDFEFDSVERKAIVGFSRKTVSQVDFGNEIHIVMVPEFIQEITGELGRHSPMQMAIPEGYPLLRAIQFAIAYGGLRV